MKQKNIGEARGVKREGISKRKNRLSVKYHRLVFPRRNQNV